MSYQRTEISESDIQHQMDICAQLRAHFTAGGRQPLAMVDTYGCPVSYTHLTLPTT